MGCICAIQTGGACIFFTPSQDACADKFEEVEHTKQWMKKEGKSDETN